MSEGVYFTSIMANPEKGPVQTRATLKNFFLDVGIGKVYAEDSQRKPASGSPDAFIVENNEAPLMVYGHDKNDRGKRFPELAGVDGRRYIFTDAFYQDRQVSVNITIREEGQEAIQTIYTASELPLRFNREIENEQEKLRRFEIAMATDARVIYDQIENF